MRVANTILASASLYAFGAVAVSFPGSGIVSRALGLSSSTCMTDSDAQAVANTFQELIHAYSNAAAVASLTTNYHDYTDSVTTLMDSACTKGPVELGTATFPSLVAFEAGQGSQPSIPFEQLNVWHNCQTVTLRWLSRQKPEQVTGIIVLETVYQNGKWMIETTYSEFNSGAWLVNLGLVKPTNCNAQGVGLPPPGS